MSEPSGSPPPRLIASPSAEDAAAVLDTVVRHAPFGFVLFDLEHRYVVVNEQAAAMNGVPVDAHLGRHIVDVVPDMAKQAIELLSQVARTGMPVVDVEFVGETAADPGRRRIWTASFHRIETADGRVVGVAVISREVTAERALHRRETERALLAMADASLEPVLVLSPVEGNPPNDFWIEHANQAVLDSLDGVGATAVVGRRLYSVFAWLPAVGLHEQYLDVLASGEPFTASALPYPPELVARHGHGRFDVSLSRSGEHLVVSWRDTTTELELEQHRARLAIERARVERMQAAFLPRQLPAIDGVELATAYRAAGGGAAIGGDWYDAIETASGIAFCIGDVAGHGIDAVETMAVGRVAWRAYAQLDDAPDIVLERLSVFLRAQARRQQIGCFVTVLSAHYDVTRRTVRWATAGHVPPLILDGDGARVLAGTAGPPIGVTARGFPVHEVQLPAEATIVLYTDGLIERRDEGIDESIARLERVARTLPLEPASLCASIVERLASDDHVDDVCVLALRA